MPRHRAEICDLNRREKRAMDLTNARIMEMYEEVRARCLENGCTCGVTRIQPLPKGGGEFSVNVFHAQGCGLNELEEKRRAARRAKRWGVRYRLHRFRSYLRHRRTWRDE